MMRMQRKVPTPTHAQELVKLRTGRELGDLLHEMYVRDGQTQDAIARELGVTRLTVARWLLETGITREDRGVPA